MEGELGVIPVPFNSDLWRYLRDNGVFDHAGDVELRLNNDKWEVHKK